MAGVVYMDFVELIIKELQKSGLEVGSVSEFTQKVLAVENDLQSAGHQFFVAHPELDETPYAVFIVKSQFTGKPDLVPAVGNASMHEQMKDAIAMIYSGALKREVIRDS